MSKNQLIIAAAGSGKTTYLVDQIKSAEGSVLITTYTDENKKEIAKKMLEVYGCIPSHITVKTWFSFLLEQGVRPYQDVLNDEYHRIKIGFHLSSQRSGRIPTKDKTKILYYGELNNFKRYYFDHSNRIFSDKISKFICRINDKTGGEVISRLSRIYQNIFIDEVQDLAGWDLELIKLFSMSNSKVLLVGDPRQVTYLTNHSTKYKKYKNGKILDFLFSECNGLFKVSADILCSSHRNNKDICDYSSKLFPEFVKTIPCVCTICRQEVCAFCGCNVSEHQGIKLIGKDDVTEYVEQYRPQVLRRELSKHPELNFGVSKGKSFCRVLIYPTGVIEEWINDTTKDIPFTTRCKLYVALTRARHSVAIVGNRNTTRQLSLF